MSPADVLGEAMKLSKEERAALARELLASLDSANGQTEQEWEEAVGKEVQARLARMDRGESVPRDCHEAMAEIQKPIWASEDVKIGLTSFRENGPGLAKFTGR